MRNSGFKTAALLLLGVFLTGILPAQEQEGLTFVAERDTVSRKGFTIHAGELITTDNWAGYGRMSNNHPSEVFHLVLSIVDTRDEDYVFAKDFRPPNTADVFGEGIFIDYPADFFDPDIIDNYPVRRGEWGISLPLSFGNPPAAITDEMWLPDYYADILRGQDRMKLFNMRPEVNIRDDERTPWYQSPLVSLVHGRAMFYNSVIMLGRGTHLVVKNIQKTDFGYQVDAVVSVGDDRQWGLAGLWGSEFWNAYKPGDAVTLLLHLDGDYLDIYTADSNIHVGTFIKARREFIVQYESLIRTNTCDLTNVQWPKRADGGTEFSPPVADVSGFQASHKTADRLRMREKADTGSAIVTTLDTGTGVQLLETGATETIGGITAPWVKVLSENGFTGWVFSGYLEAQNPEQEKAETQNPDSENLKPENVETQNPDSENLNPENTKSGFPVLPFAIAGSVILVAGTVTIVVLAKRRKGKAEKP